MTPTNPLAASDGPAVTLIPSDSEFATSSLVVVEIKVVASLASTSTWPASASSVVSSMMARAPPRTSFRETAPAIPRTDEPVPPLLPIPLTSLSATVPSVMVAVMFAASVALTVTPSTAWMVRAPTYPVVTSSSVSGCFSPLTV